MIVDVDGFLYKLNKKKHTASLVTGCGLDGCVHYGLGNVRLSEKKIIIPSEISVDGEIYVVSFINRGVFECMENLEELYIPSTILDMHWSFYKCHNLKSIHVDSQNEVYCDIDGVLFSKNRQKLIAYPNLHGETYAIPGGTKIIKDLAFKSCKNLKEVVIPPSVKEMGLNVFYGCDRLDIFLPDDLRIIQRYQGDSCYYSKLLFHVSGKIYTLDEINELYNNR